MNRCIAFGLRWLLVVLVAFIIGCGGGGGTGATSDSAGSVVSLQNAQLLVPDTSAVTVAVMAEDISSYTAAPENAAMFQRTVSLEGVDIARLPEDFVLMAVVNDEAAVNQVYVDFQWLEAGRFRMNIRPSGGLAPGEYSGEIRLVACRLNKTGADCAEHVKGSPSAPIAYHFTIYPHLWLDTYSSTVWRTQGDPSTSQGSIRVSRVISRDDLTANVIYSRAGDGWLSLTPTDVGYDYTVQASDLPIGDRSAQVVITSALTGVSVTSTVELFVRENTFSTVHSGGLVEVTNDTVPADLSFEAPVTLLNPAVTTRWEASADVPWILFDKSAGQTGENVAYRISTTHLAAMTAEDRRIPVGEHGVITIRNQGTLTVSPVTLPVDIHRYTTELDAVLSPPAPAGIAGYKVQLSGRNLNEQSRLTASGPSPIEVLPDGNVPVVPTAAGTYVLAATNTLGLPTRQVTATFLATAQHASGFMASSGLKRSMVYDQVRDALYVVDKPGSLLRRFRHSAGTWNADTLAVPGISDVGLAPDRRQLFVSSVDGVLRRVDPAGFSVVGSHAFGQPFPEYRPLSQGLAIQGLQAPHIPFLTAYQRSGYFDLSGITAFSVNDQQFVPVVGNGYAPERGGWFVQSGDHDYVYFSQLQPDYEFGNYAGVFYDAGLRPSSGLLSFLPRPVFATLDGGLTSVGGFGLVDRRQYMGRAGHVAVDVPPVPAGFRVVGSVMSADWKYIYLLAYPEAAINGDQTTTLKPRLFTYRVEGLGNFGTSTTVTAMLDVVELSDFPTCRRDADTSCLLDTVSATSMDGRTLFFAGDRGVAVVALPAGVRSVDSFARATGQTTQAGVTAKSKVPSRLGGFFTLRGASQRVR